MINLILIVIAAVETATGVTVLINYYRLIENPIGKKPKLIKE